MSYTLRTSNSPSPRCASAGSTLVASTTAGSGRAASATGSVSMKPGGGAATFSQVC